MKDKVIIYPTVKKMENRYINNLYKIIRNTYEVKGYDECKNLKEKLDVGIYHFNWIENENRNDIRGKVNYIKKIIFILFLKASNKRIIWTVHNSLPHETKKNKYTINFMKFMAKKSDRIHILCKETLNFEYLSKYSKKVVYIPHGDYIENYPQSDIDIYERYNIPKTKKIILFIGQVRKYKNIEILIKAFKNSNIVDNEFILLICGKCNDKEYEKELKKLSNENIFFDFNFIKDDEMEAYLRSSQIIVAPYNKQSSLNSGTLWMAMSYKKTMMIPLIGCVKDIENYNDNLYIYDYEDESKHYDSLLDCFKQLKKDIEENNNVLQEKEKRCYKYINEKQSWKSNQNNWINLYKF